jgi:two-component system, chemotaxis family, sensor kinase CheA
MPSLMVSAGEERVAIPLVNVQKLMRIAAGEVAQKIKRVGGARVLMLDDAVLPLVDLDAAPGIEAPAAGSGPGEFADALNVVLVSGGMFRYGLVVKGLHDTMEIVVKPLAQRLKHLQEYAGATILGDGSVALILDIAGLATVSGLAPENSGAQVADVSSSQPIETHRLLLFQNSPTEACGLPLDVVARVEKVRAEQVETVGGRRSMQYRGRSLPLVTLADSARACELALGSDLVVVILERSGREIGLLASRPVDVLEADVEIDPFTYRQTGVIGSAILRELTTLILDPFEIAGKAWPGWNADSQPAQTKAQAGRAGASILVAEDSTFFREQILRLLEESGYRVRTAVDGQEAWEILAQDAASIQLVITDVEMPRMDGLELTRKIRADERASGLPVLMLTSLAGEEDIQRGQAAGATNYCVKLDRDQLLGAIHELLAGAGKPALAELSRGLARGRDPEQTQDTLETEGEAR